MLAYLADPERVASDLRRRGDDGGPDLQEAKDAVADLGTELKQLKRGVESGEVSAWVATSAEKGVRERLRDAQRRVDELSTPSRLRGLIGPGPDAHLRWDDAEMSTRREVAKILLAPDALGQLRIRRSPTPGKRAPVEERLVWWNGDAQVDTPPEAS
jgi:site-specific DNA recombinase